MKKVFSFLTSLILVGVWSATAQATGSDSNTFLLNPASVLTVSANSGQWPNAFITNGVYPRNVYWNFNVDPRPSVNSASCVSNCNPDAIYYGDKDVTLKSSDKFFTTGSVTYAGSGATGELGLATNHNKSGTAVFEFSTTGLKNTNNQIYVWAEINLTTTGNSSNNINFSSLTNDTTGALLFSNSGGTPLATGSNVFSYNMTGTNAIYDAYFAVTNPASLESLTLTFNQSTGNNLGSAFVNSLHIAVTPEPMAMALFATGVAVLFFFKRRRFALV